MGTYNDFKSKKWKVTQADTGSGLQVGDTLTFDGDGNGTPAQFNTITRIPAWGVECRHDGNDKITAKRPNVTGTYTIQHTPAGGGSRAKLQVTSSPSGTSNWTAEEGG